jgi:RimJ/RimL family protein N-acetyltransferase
MRFTTVPATYTTSAATEWIRRGWDRADRGTAMVLAIVKAGELSPVGMAGLFGLDQGDRTARLGYWVLAHARRSGLAFAAANALTGWGFDRLGLAQVLIDTEPGNLASARIAEKLGATESGAHLVEFRGSEVTLIRYAVHRPRD